MEKDIMDLQEYVENALDWIAEAKFLTEEFLLLDSNWEDMMRVLHNLRSIDTLLRNALDPIVEVIKKAEEHLEHLEHQRNLENPPSISNAG